jgi:(2S)-methylsuccinyl-CoA dehydrogenase
MSTASGVMSASAALRELALVAGAILRKLRDGFECVSSDLARICAGGGSALDPRRLDEQQIPCYELAAAGAELLAAETAVSQVSQTSSLLDLRLALTCAAEAVGTVGDRLLLAGIDLDTDMQALRLLLASSEVRTFRKSLLGARALEETGRLLCEADEEIGHVPLNGDLTLVQEQFRRFAAAVVQPLARQIHREDLTVPEELLGPLRAMGVFGLSIPQRFGGSASDDREDNLPMIVVTEALSEASLAAAGSLITRPEILARALLSGGTPGQQDYWLPRIAAGDPLCAIAITEPNHGSDVASLQFKGTRVPGGWRLDGTKTWCTFAGKAGLIMAVTRTHADRSLGHRGLSVFLVEKPSYDGHAFYHEPMTGGRLSGKAIPTIGYRGMHSFELSFENLFVPDANVIGGEAGIGKGFYYTMAGMTGGRLQTAARACGVMRAALLAAIRYAGDRVVFGAPLAAYALTRSKLARMAARFAACRQLVYAVGRQMDRGDGRMESSLVKLYACRSAEWITRESLQVHGAMGYAEESAVSRYFVDARVLSIFEGAEETLALKVIARSFLERSLSAANAEVQSAEKRGPV